MPIASQIIKYLSSNFFVFFLYGVVISSLSSCYTVYPIQTADVVGKGKIDLGLGGLISPVEQIDDTTNNRIFSFYDDEEYANIDAFIYTRCGLTKSSDLGILIGLQDFNFLIDYKYQWVNTRENKYRMATSIGTQFTFNELSDRGLHSLNLDLINTYSVDDNLDIFLTPYGQIQWLNYRGHDYIDKQLYRLGFSGGLSVRTEFFDIRFGLTRNFPINPVSEEGYTDIENYTGIFTLINFPLF